DSMSVPVAFELDHGDDPPVQGEPEGRHRDRLDVPDDLLCVFVWRCQHVNLGRSAVAIDHDPGGGDLWYSTELPLHLGVVKVHAPTLPVATAGCAGPPWPFRSALAEYHQVVRIPFSSSRN